MKIVIIGGYGAVGKIISRELSVVYPNQVVVAGRDGGKAKKLADVLKNGVVSYQVDVNHIKDTEFWDNVQLVVMCLDQEDTRFVKFCLEKGIHYIDISANYDIIGKIEKLNQEEVKSAIVLSVGLAPGLTNLLVQHGISQVKAVEGIDIFVLLGLGEKHGDHAFRWTFDNIHKEYTVLRNGKYENVKSFTWEKKTNLEGRRSFYLFDFSDQHVLAKTTAAKSVTTRMAFDVNVITKSVGLLRKWGLTKVFRSKRVQRLLMPIFKNLGFGSDIYGVKAVVYDEKGESYESSVSGYGEGRVTALVAAKTAEYILQNPVKPGVSHLHEVINDIPAFLMGLDKEAKVNLS